MIIHHKEKYSNGFNIPAPNWPLKAIQFISFIIRSHKLKSLMTNCQSSFRIFFSSKKSSLKNQSSLCVRVSVCRGRESSTTGMWQSAAGGSWRVAVPMTKVNSIVMVGVPVRGHPRSSSSPVLLFTSYPLGGTASKWASPRFRFVSWFWHGTRVPICLGRLPWCGP